MGINTEVELQAFHATEKKQCLFFVFFKQLHIIQFSLSYTALCIITSIPEIHRNMQKSRLSDYSLPDKVMEISNSTIISN